MQKKNANWTKVGATAILCCFLTAGYEPLCNSVREAVHDALKKIAHDDPGAFSPLENPLHERNRKILFDAENDGRF